MARSLWSTALRDVVYRPFRLDWRFLPEQLLVCKDSLRHVANKFGGGTHHASHIGKAWFTMFHAATLSAVRRRGVLFVHVPRTGGSSTSQLLYGRNLPHASLAFWHTVGGAWIQRLPSFSIIRSPVERIISSYRFMRSGGTELMACSRYDPLGLRKSSSLEDFVDALALQPAHMRSYDTLRKQSEYVTDPTGRLLVDRLFAFEDVAKSSSDIRRWLGIGSIPALNASEGPLPELPVRTRRLIETLYGDDLTLYESIRGRSARAEAQTFFRQEPPLRRGQAR